MKIYLVAIVVLLAGCGKSDDSFYSDAKAAIAANKPSEAERILQEGLSKHSDSDKLISALVTLYADTNQPDKLESYLKMNYFKDKGQYLRQLADIRFQNREWKKAYETYLEEGDRYLEEDHLYLEEGDWHYGKSPCPLVSPEAYRNAAAASINAGIRSWHTESMNRLSNMLSKCGEDRRGEIQKFIDEMRR